MSKICVAGSQHPSTNLSRNIVVLGEDLMESQGFPGFAIICCLEVNEWMVYFSRILNFAAL